MSEIPVRIQNRNSESSKAVWFLWRDKQNRLDSELFLALLKNSISGITYTGKSLSEALLFCRTWGEHVVYKNCSECQKQFLYTTCSPQV